MPIRALSLLWLPSAAVIISLSLGCGSDDAKSDATKSDSTRNRSDSDTSLDGGSVPDQLDGSAPRSAGGKGGSAPAGRGGANAATEETIPCGTKQCPARYDVDIAGMSAWVTGCCFADGCGISDDFFGASREETSCQPLAVEDTSCPVPEGDTSRGDLEIERKGCCTTTGSCGVYLVDAPICRSTGAPDVQSCTPPGPYGKDLVVERFIRTDNGNFPDQRTEFVAIAESGRAWIGRWQPTQSNVRGWTPTWAPGLDGVKAYSVVTTWGGCWVTAKDKVLCSGDNQGNATTMDKTMPLSPTGIEGRPVDVVANNDSRVVLTESGDIYYWGKLPVLSKRIEGVEITELIDLDSNYGLTSLVVKTREDAVGTIQGVETDEPKFTKVFSDVLQVANTRGVDCAVTRKGEVFCCGDNSVGTAGRGNFEPADCYQEMIAVVGVTDAVSVAVAGDRACAALSDGGLMCWGDGKSIPEPQSGFPKFSYIDGLRDIGFWGLTEGRVYAWESDASTLTLRPPPNPNDEQ
jgi:hypothetical protein